MIASVILVGGLVVGAGSSVSALAGKQPPAGTRRVAVSELETGYQADPKLARTLSVLFTSELRRRPGLSVISQDDVRTLLGLERQRQLLRCGSASCLAEIAGALGASTLVAGSLSRVGDSLVLVVRRLDATHARVVHDGRRSVSFYQQDGLQTAVTELAAELFPDEPLPSQPVPEQALLEVEAPAPQRSSLVPPLVLSIGGVVLAAAGAGLSLDALQPGSGSTQTITYGQALGKNREATTGVVLLSSGIVAGLAGLIWGIAR